MTRVFVVGTVGGSVNMQVLRSREVLVECVRCRKPFDESELMVRGNIAACLDCSQELFSPKAPCAPDATKRVTFVALKQANRSRDGCVDGDEGR